MKFFLSDVTNFLAKWGITDVLAEKELLKLLEDAYTEGEYDWDNGYDDGYNDNY